VNQIKIAYARTPATQQAPAVVSSTPSSETAPAAASQVKPAVAISQEPLTAPLPPKPSRSRRFPSDARTCRGERGQGGHSQCPSPRSRAAEKGAAGFSTQRYYLRDLNPSAIVNGQRVNLGDWVDGANVVGIGRTTVTLQINSQRKVYQLR